MSAKAKKSAVKKPVAKKPAAKAVAKKPAAKKPAAKKPVAKKPVAKAPAAKKSVEKKPVAKKPIAKPAAAKPVEAVSAASAKSAKKDVVRKPITVVKKAPRPPLRKAETPVVFENQSQAVAFSFAEMMKKRQKELDASRKEASDATAVKLSRRPTSRTRGEASQQFPASDLADFRKRLILLRQEAMGHSATLKTIALEHTDDRGSEDDDGSDAFMRLQNLSQVDSHNKVIQQIDEALARIQDGTYGICEICGQLIRKPRLLNLPFVHTCMECQSAMEEKPMGMR
ncbi:MAG: TraR/DksA family transcriptional regulator [Kiritimatiellae bacterium]|nr:TraR/DksA family transcriptional regulator [Kiritimatiellia bacterium]